MKRALGGRAVFPIGLGAMPLSIEGRPDESTALRVIHAALAAGVELVDTADVYGLDATDAGHGERLIGKALRTWPGARPLVATKGGVVRAGDAWRHDGTPGHLRRACEASLLALGVERIDLYQLHAPDTRVPIEESAGELARLAAEGKIDHIGLSNVSVGELERARRAAPIASVQNEASPYRPTGLTDGVLAACESLGLAFIAWAPVGGWRAGRVAHEPVLQRLAGETGSTPHQLVLAWLLARSPSLLAIPGASRPENAVASAVAASIVLTSDQRTRIDRAFLPPGG